MHRLEELALARGRQRHRAAERLGPDVWAGQRSEDGEDRCLACAAGVLAAQVEGARALEELAAEHGRSAYLEHQDLCRAHLWMLLAQAPEEVAEWLFEVTRQRLAALTSDLDLYFHRLDHRHRDEPKGAEQSAWRRALRYFRADDCLSGAKTRASPRVVTGSRRGC
jgi:hypothetical protein